MLSSFKVRNFRSIQDLSLDMSFAEKRAPAGYQDTESLFFLESQKKIRLVPTLAIYGANASGKSNVLKAVKTFSDCILSGIQGQFRPNKLQSASHPVSFEAAFVFDGHEYRYELQYDRETILKEVFHVDSHRIYSITDSDKWFDGLSTQAYPLERLLEIYRVECCDPRQHQTVTFLAIMGKRYQGLHHGITELYRYINDHLIVLSDNSIHLSRGVNALADVMAKADEPEPLHSAFEEITGLLESLDIHITRMAIDRTRMRLEHDANHTKDYLDAPAEFYNRITSVEKEGDNIVLNADSIHSFHKDNDGNEIEFDFTTEESSGTQIVAGLLGIFLAALKTGGTVIVDELDRSLHSLLLIQLIRLFKEKRYNENNAQLIFTVHNTDILDVGLMRVSEVGIISKTTQDGTTLVRISDFKEIENVASFRRQYLNGQFSGIPFPYV